MFFFLFFFVDAQFMNERIDHAQPHNVARKMGHRASFLINMMKKEDASHCWINFELRETFCRWCMANHGTINQQNPGLVAKPIMSLSFLLMIKISN